MEIQLEETFLPPLLPPYDECTLLEEIFTNGDDLQKMSVIQSLPKLLECDYDKKLSRIIPIIQHDLPSLSLELNLIASRVFRVLIALQIPLNLVGTVLTGIYHRDAVVSSTWMETLVVLIPTLSERVIQTEMLECAVKKSQTSQPVYARVTSCGILGQIAIHQSISAFDVKKNVLPYVQSLCLDCQPDVRAAMCLELPNIAQGVKPLGDSEIRQNLLPLLVELSSDDKTVVRSAAIDSVAKIINYLTPETIQLTIIPLVKQICTTSINDQDHSFVYLAKAFGKIVTSLRDELTEADAVWFLAVYNTMARKGVGAVKLNELQDTLAVTCREFCALHLPDVTTMMVTIIPKEALKWYEIFHSLASDPCYVIRKAVAGAFHEVCNALGDIKRSYSLVGHDINLVRADFIELLRDDAEEVLTSIVPHIAVTLRLFCLSGVLSREHATKQTKEIGKALIKCRNGVFKTHNWRLKVVFLRQLEFLPFCFPSDFIYQNFTPLVLDTIRDAKGKPVRSQAARTALVLLRYNVKENQRKRIRDVMVSDVCRSPCCYTRIVFIDLCCHATDIFSNKYFKMHFYGPLLGLADDKVSNVRLSFVKVCPMLKQMIVLPNDRSLLTRLENTIVKLETDSNRDVMERFKTKVKDVLLVTVTKEKDTTEEKRRKEEEDVFKGKIMNLPLPESVSTNQIDLDKPLFTSLKYSESVANTKNSQPKQECSSNSDMRFLGHHFYIDAGVNLPKKMNDSEGIVEKKLIISSENVNVKNMSPKDVANLQTSTTNITDDVKADLRKINMATENKREEVRKRHKRYSFAFETCATSSEKAMNRRSLNIVASESRIPIKKRENEKKPDGEKKIIGKKCNNDLKENLPNSNENVPRKNKEKFSNLPVLKQPTTNDLNIKRSK